MGINIQYKLFRSSPVDKLCDIACHCYKNITQWNAGPLQIVVQC